MTSYSTSTLDGTEQLAIRICRDDYAHGDIDHNELERRIEAIIGLRGHEERIYVLTHDVERVDITEFGNPDRRMITTAWNWPS